MDWHKISKDSLYFGLRMSQATAMSLFLITGLIGNTLVCFLVRRTPRLRTVTNLIISNLAATDLGVCIFKIPVSLVTVIYNDWIFGSIVCQIAGFFNSLLLYEALSSLALVSISRYCCIVQPSKFSSIFSKKRTMFMISLTWALSILCAIPPFFGWSHYLYQPSKATCDAQLIQNLSYTITFAIIVFIVPFILILVLYFKIFRFIRATSRRLSPRTLQNYSAKRTYKSLFHDFKVTKLLLVVVCVFVACWTPHIITHLLGGFGFKPIPPVVDAASTLLTFLSSTINPFIYALMSKQFRKGFRDIFRSLCRKYFKSGCCFRFLDRHGTHASSFRRSTRHRTTSALVTVGRPSEIEHIVYESCV